MTVLEQYLPDWVLQYLSPMVLLIGGILALAIVALYLKDKESGKYKAMVALGAIFGVLIVVLAVLQGFNAQKYTMILIAIAAFTLIIRPVREVHFSLIIGLMVMIIVYIALAGLNGYMLFNNFDLTALSTGWPRIIIAFIAGAIVYGLLNFAEGIVKLVGKLLNCWPVFFVLGLICIAEAACMLMGYGSIFDYINDVPWDKYIEMLKDRAEQVVNLI